MKPTNLALIDIAAEGSRRSVVTREAVDKVASDLGLSQAGDPAVMDEAARAAVVGLVGETAADLMSAPEFEVLTSGLSRLPPSAPAESFVWGAVATPKDVDPLVKAVVVYHRFNAGAVEVSERIGANDEFRRFVRQSNAEPNDTLASVIETEQRYVDRIGTFMDGINAMIASAERVFPGGGWTIASLLTLTSAVGGLTHSAGSLGRGWNLLFTPTPRCLDEVEALRIELAYAGGQVNELCGLNLLKYSMPSLSGLRRSLFEGGADFEATLSSFGVDGADPDRVVAIAEGVRQFFDLCDRLDGVLTQGGYRAEDMPDVISHVVLRRYLAAAAEANGVEWSSVEEQLRPGSSVSPEAVAALLEALRAEGFSSKLESISRDKGQSIVNVLLAAEHYVYSRQYWIDAGKRVLAHDPEIRMVDLRAILEMEPEIHGNTEMLAKAGAICRADVDELEGHLEWLIAVYSLPLSNAAVSKIVATRGEAVAGLRG